MRDVEPDVTKIFLRSLRKHWDGLVVLVVDDPEVYHDEKTLVILFDELPETASTTMDWFPPDAKFFLFRHWVLLKVLGGHGGLPFRDVDGMWVLDARDVYFQDDPFRQVPLDAELVFTDEMRPPPAEPGPIAWVVEDYYGKEAVEGIRNSLYICAGAIWGTPHGLKLMSEGILAEYRQLLGRRAVKETDDDQAIVNWLFHRGKIPGRLFENGRGPVVHFSRLLETDFSWSDDGKVHLCGTENYPAILHHYDRFRAVRNEVENLYDARVMGRRD